jgi:uncharacterized membrane protein
MPRIQTSADYRLAPIRNASTAEPPFAQAGIQPNQHRNSTMNRYVTMGLGVLAGAALFEAALIPGVVIGGAAALAPHYLPRLTRRLFPDVGQLARPRRRPGEARPPGQSETPRISLPAGLRIKQAVAKTITFRIIVTGLDFTTNYVVLGELTIAAGLSTFSLVVGPVFYFAHETLWNYFVPTGSNVDLAVLRAIPARARAEPKAIAINRPLAKTITFRTFATVMDFTTNYVVIGNAATAAVLTAFGFVFGPFVYLGHEMLWDNYGAERQPIPGLPAPTNAELPIGCGSNAKVEPS